MRKLGIVESEDTFYEILYDKWREYLHRIKSGIHLIQIMGRDFVSSSGYERTYGSNQNIRSWA